MSGYLDSNRAYWERGYHAPNVDHNVFRFYGRVLRPDFKLNGNGERLVDFGCGQGAAVNFFVSKGFDARGVDISEKDIGIARTRYPDIAQRFDVCQPKPAANKAYGFPDNVAVVTAIQSLYYFSRQDFNDALEKLHASMRRGGVFYATMMAEGAREFFDNSKPADDWLRVVNFQNDRVQVSNYFMFFVRDEDHLRALFPMFEPRHIGYYAAKFRNDEGDGMHYTFVGVKR